MPLTLVEKRQAASLAGTCTGLLSLDEIWTERLSTPIEEPNILSGIGREIANDLQIIMENLDLIEHLSHAVTDILTKPDSEQAEALSGYLRSFSVDPDMLPNLTAWAITVARENGLQEINDLLDQASALDHNLPAHGDMKRIMRIACVAIAGVLFLAAGLGAVAVVSVVAAPVVVPVLSGAGVALLAIAAKKWIDGPAPGKA